MSISLLFNKIPVDHNSVHELGDADSASCRSAPLLIVHFHLDRQVVKHILGIDLRIILYHLYLGSCHIGQSLLECSADTLFDLSWQGKDTNNRIDYAFFGGLKIYPNIGGLNASISYALGRRTDSITNGSDDALVLSSAWGNGFRFSIEYDFLYDKTWKCAPIAGMYYRMMPRGGNYYDNIIAVYGGITF